MNICKKRGCYQKQGILLGSLVLSVALSLSVNLSLKGWAQLKMNLNLQQALAIAARNNLRFKALQAELGISDADIVTARTRLNPSFLADNGVAEYTYRFGIEQTFELGGKRVRRTAVAQAEKRLVEEEIREGLLALYDHVRQTYTQLYYDQARYQTYQHFEETAEKLVEAANKRLESGQGNELDVMQTEIKLLSIKNNLLVEGRLIQEARNDLNFVLNLPLSTQHILEPPTIFPSLLLGNTATPLPSRDALAAMDLGTLISQALERHPALKAAEAKAAVLPEELRLSKAKRIPNLSVTVGPDTITEPTPTYSVFVIATMDLPVFNRQQGPIQRIQAETNQQALEVAFIKNRLKREVSNAYNAVMTHEEAVVRFETEILPLAKNLREKGLRYFETGDTSVLAALNAQEQYTEAVLGHLESLKELQNALNELEKALAAGV
ncbi:TolC family protein [Vampirovibrio sp.]|uniref:TolC family protein n=1 Tax=Vampirovibrio sp. TaxID=2717857 RepID=UPI003593D169